MARSERRPRGAVMALALVAGVAVGAVALGWDVLGAQGWGMRGRDLPDDMGTAPYSAKLTFARLRFEPRATFRGHWANGMPAWGHDYPHAERNFMRILDEITTARTFHADSRIVDLDDPALFQFPIAYLCEAGFLSLNDREETALRDYLLKGGFIIFDDFSGSDWQNFETMMRRVLPDVRFLPLELDHPVFRSFFEIEALSLPSYRGRQPEFYGVFQDNDPAKRLMAVVNYNADIGDFWEYSDRGFLPVDMSNEAYKLGVNYWMYALSH